MNPEANGDDDNGGRRDECSITVRFLSDEPKENFGVAANWRCDEALGCGVYACCWSNGGGLLPA